MIRTDDRDSNRSAAVCRWLCAQVRRRLRGTGGADADGGYVSFYVVVITLGLLAMAGLVIDGGNAIAARERAADTAGQAARAGADALNPTTLRTGGVPAASTTSATQAADVVLADGHVTGTVTVHGQDVTVTVVVHQPTTILSAVGLDTISGTATATATSLRGTTSGSTG